MTNISDENKTNTNISTSVFLFFFVLCFFIPHIFLKVYAVFTLCSSLIVEIKLKHLEFNFDIIIFL